MFSKSSKSIAFCSLANCVNAADRVILPITIIAMSKEFSWSMRTQGWIHSAFSLGYISSQVIGGSVVRKFGGKPILALSVLIWSLSIFVTPFVAFSLVAMLLARIMLGFGEGFGIPSIFHIFSHCLQVHERSRAFGYFVAFGSIGQSLVIIFCPHLYWKYPFFFLGILGFVWVLLWLMYFQEASSYSSHLYAPLNAQDEALMSGFSSDKVSSSSVHWTIYFKFSPFWAVYIAHFAMNWCNYIVMSWLPTYLTSKLDASNESLSFTAMPYVINSIFGVFAGHFADNLIANKKWTVLSVRRLMTTIGLFGPGLFLLFFASVNSIALAVIFISLSMALCAFNSCGHLSNHPEIAPNHASITFAISNTIATIPGIICGPLTAEIVAASSGRWFPVFLLSSLINFLAGVIYVGYSSSSQVI